MSSSSSFFLIFINKFKIEWLSLCHIFPMNFYHIFELKSPKISSYKIFFDLKLLTLKYCSVSLVVKIVTHRYGLSEVVKTSIWRNQLLFLLHSWFYAGSSLIIGTHFSISFLVVIFRLFLFENILERKRKLKMY
jgi:hypothetical protein